MITKRILLVALSGATLDHGREAGAVGLADPTVGECEVAVELHAHDRPRRRTAALNEPNGDDEI
jgi:hypothetical protein